jgi:hypothetical protein
MYVREDNRWEVKGRFEDAVIDDEPVTWVTSNMGKYSLTLLAVSSFNMSLCELLMFFQEDAITSSEGSVPGSVASSRSASISSRAMSSVSRPVSVAGSNPPSRPASASGDHTSDTYSFLPGSMSWRIATALQVPAYLTYTPHARTSDMRLAYARYLAALDAQKRITSKEILAHWDGRKPTQEEITDVFVQKTSWHSTYVRTFSKLYRNPAMQKWLEGAIDAPRDDEVWKTQRKTFTNLYAILEQSNPDSAAGGSDVKEGKKKKRKSGSPEEVARRDRKGKDKERVKERVKEKGKVKEHKASSSKVRD